MRAISTILSWSKVFILDLFLLCSYTLSQAQHSAWKEFGKLHYARHYFGGLVFAPKLVLVMGGYINSNGALTGEITNSCELIDVARRSIKDAAPMNIPRAESVFLLTADSNIVAISGLSRNNQTTPTCEIYSRITHNWSVLGSLNIGRRQHIACFINPDEILVVGGRDNTVGTIASAEIFNIRTGRSRFVQDFPYPINLGVSDVSSQNKPLFFGGRAGGANSFRTVDVHEYDAANNRWLVATQILEGVHGPNLLKLWNNKLLFAGGSKQESPIAFSASVAIENYPRFNQLTSIQRRHWHTMAQWNSDSVAVIGGLDEKLNNLQSVEWIDLKQQHSFPAPMLIEPHGRFISVSVPEFDVKGKQARSIILAISGLLSDNSINTPTVEILEQTITPQIPPFPSITSTLTETNNCNIFRLTVRTQSSSDVIRAIELGTSANVTLEVLTALPAASVEILVRLQNPFAPPALTSLRITDDAARTELIPISVSFPQRQNLALSIVGMTEHLFGDSVVTPVCVALRLRNNAPTEAMFPLAYFGRNIEFSAPLSQFPFRVPAGGEAALRLCYTPSALGLQRDTLTLTQNCTTLRIPLVARGVGEVLAGTSRCDVPVKLRTVLPVSGETTLIAGTPFPQPSSDIVSVPVYLSAEAPPMQMPTAMLYDGLGRLMGQYEAEWSTGVQSTNLRYSYSGVVPIRTEALPMGFYRMIIRSADGAMTSMGVIIVH